MYTYIPILYKRRIILWITKSHDLQSQLRHHDMVHHQVPVSHINGHLLSLCEAYGSADIAPEYGQTSITIW